MPAAEAKIRNIIEMAMGFTSMARVFERGATKRIKEKLYETYGCLKDVHSWEKFAEIHDAFCKWFVSNIKLAKGDERASYGHGAKVLDIALKVMVYYCRLPDHQKAETLIPMLRCGIDTPIFKHLMQKFDGGKTVPVYILTIKDIGEGLYPALQEMVVSDIRDSFNGSLHPVQYDDVMWRQLNRETD